MNFILNSDCGLVESHILPRLLAMERPPYAVFAKIVICIFACRSPALDSFMDSKISLTTLATILENFTSITAPLWIPITSCYHIFDILKSMLMQYFQLDCLIENSRFPTFFYLFGQNTIKCLFIFYNIWVPKRVLLFYYFWLRWHLCAFFLIVYNSLWLNRCYWFLGWFLLNIDLWFLRWYLFNFNYWFLS